MESSVRWGIFFIACLETISGVFTNLFIIFRVFYNHWRHRDVSGCEKIIVALSISNLCHSCEVFAATLTFTMNPVLLFSAQVYPVFFVLTFFILISSAWLTTSLCFYYYIKINHFTSNLLCRLKLKINSLALWMIPMSVLLSLFCSLINILQIIVQEKYSTSISAFRNTSRPCSSNGICNSILYMSFVATFIPFHISVVTMASTVWSLHLHKLKMARNQTSPTNGNMRKYEGAIKIMLSLLTFYGLMYVALCLYYFHVFDPSSDVFWCFLVILCAYSPVHSVLLSLSSNKLKRAWMKVFSCKAESINDEENRDE